jgi:hypothetical protein
MVTTDPAVRPSHQGHFNRIVQGLKLPLLALIAACLVVHHFLRSQFVRRF